MDDFLAAAKFTQNIRDKKWDEVDKVFTHTPDVLVGVDFTEEEIDILWTDAPFSTICSMLRVFPEVYCDMVKAKRKKKQWDFLVAVFLEFPDLLATRTKVDDFVRCNAPLEFLLSYWDDVPMLLYSICNKDWEMTKDILGTQPRLEEQKLTTDDYDILWTDAPLTTICSMLRTFPEVYDRMLAAKKKKKQWDFLDGVFKEFPELLATTTEVEDFVRCKAPLEFLFNYWLDVPMLLYSICNKDWEMAKDILGTQPKLEEQKLTAVDYDTIWNDGPVEVVIALLKVTPGVDTSHKSNLVNVKMKNKQWDFLDGVFKAFPEMLATTTEVEDFVRCKAPREFLLSNWADAPMLLYSICNKDWEMAKDTLVNQPILEEQKLTADDYDTIWNDGPVEVVIALLKLTPGVDTSHKSNLVNVKMKNKQWDFLDMVFTEVPDLITLTTKKTVTGHGASLDFVAKHSVPSTSADLREYFDERNWEETSKLLKEQPTFATAVPTQCIVLHEYAPLEVICDLFEALPVAYKEQYFDRISEFRSLVEYKLYALQWDFLDGLFNKYPDIPTRSDAIFAVRNKAPDEFIQKHWKEFRKLSRAVEAKDWEKVIELLENEPDLTRHVLSTDEVGILWKYAPAWVVCALFRASSDISEVQDTNGHNFLLAKLHNKDWGCLGTVIQEFPQITEGTDETFRGKLQYQFDTLWRNDDINDVLALLKAWPDAYKEKDSYGNDLLQEKRKHQEDALNTIIREFPHVVTENNAMELVRYHVPQLDVFEMILEKHPNVFSEDSDYIFGMIGGGEIENFRTVLKYCPGAVDVQHNRTKLTPLLTMFQDEQRMNADWIGPILKANPKAANQKDFDGKTPLHLAYQHGASSEIIDMLLEAYPEGESERDNLGRFPKDLSTNQSEKSAFTPAKEAMILTDDILRNENDAYPENAVVLCHGHILMRDPPPAQKKDGYLQSNYAQQVLTRHTIFATLGGEFSKMVGINNKNVIQKAATIQALAVKNLSQGNNTIVDFESFDNKGYWFQQEILKLVMRVYHETQSEMKFWRPSINSDASKCLADLEGRKTGASPPKPSDDHCKAFSDVVGWLTEGLDSDSYSFQGPVLKPLQSLFNKLFIRRGQTTVNVIGDMVRATLSLDDVDMFRKVVEKVRSEFPNITADVFKHPGTFDGGLAGFLRYIHGNLKFVSNSSALPYRFKKNSSQERKEEPLWYNFNFFVRMPQYHRVGQSQMFVACELHIGLTEEINSHPTSHVAYKRDRILSSQPLLKNYDATTKEGNEEDTFSRFSNCTEDENKLIEKVLFGTIASEVLIPCTTAEGQDNENNILLFENGPYALSKDEVEAGQFTKPKRLCLNNRSLNWYASDEASKDNGCAVVIGGPYSLDITKRYFVEEFGLNVGTLMGTVGLYAHVGPYMVEIACGNRGREGCVIVQSGRNLTYLEQICPVPAGTTALEVIVYGYVRNFRYEKMELTLKQFDVLK